MKGSPALAAFLEGGEDKDFVFGQIEQQYRLFGRRLDALDLRCGSGALVSWLTSGKLADYVAKCSGLDADTQKINEAKQLFGETPQRAFQTGDLVSLPFADGSLDIVTCMGNTLGELRSEIPKEGSANTPGELTGEAPKRDAATHAATNALALLKECHRLLRPNGLLILSVSNAAFAEEHAFQFSAGGRVVCAQNTFVVPGEKGTLVSHWFTKDEVAGCLRQAGFRATEPFRPAPRPGDSGELARKKSNWLIAARKA